MPSLNPECRKSAGISHYGYPRHTTLQNHMTRFLYGHNQIIMTKLCPVLSEEILLGLHDCQKKIDIVRRNFFFQKVSENVRKCQKDSESVRRFLSNQKNVRRFLVGLTRLSEDFLSEEKSILSEEFVVQY